MSGARVATLTLLALSGFAANSVLGRLALRDGAIDAASFTALRIISGAAMLVLLLRLRGGTLGGDWISAAALALYAIAFSFAYLAVSAGFGALLLFAAVQVTIIGAGLVRGERPYRHEWAGEGLAIAGVVVLLAPGFSAPPLPGAAAMLLSGVAWAAYTLRGRRASDDALAATAGNFLRAGAFALPLFALVPTSRPATSGVICALLSGALSSGLGYACWYAALPELSAVRAGIVQLAVPVLVAAVGIAFLGEAATGRLALGTALTLGGLALATLYRPPRRAR